MSTARSSGSRQRILAVIPARAASKGVPNKNVRIVGGRPLIYFAIRNALSSTMITDIIVTTDSLQVASIARQMGVDVKLRSGALSQDDVTLDSVVVDAVSADSDYSYVVTLQPTSPTLKVSSLDAAISATIARGVDTMISVVNEPRLSWRIGADGEPEPLYAERLNRQWLPAELAETGAFVISATDVLASGSRFGERVGLYELSVEEGIDVDTFDDLRCADARLRDDSTAIYVNGNNTRGIGHIYRALEMADEFYHKPDIYFDVNQTSRNVFGRTTHNLIGVDGIAELFSRCREKQYSLFVNDILTTSIDYMIGLRSVNPRAKVLNFEDDGEGASKADLVINALYSDSDLPHIYSGEKYYICSKSFLFYDPIPIRESVRRVFVSFGGADPQNYSDRLLSIISSKNKYDKYEFVVVLGRAKRNVRDLMEYNAYPNIEVMYDVDNMPELMISCDFAVTSRGRTGYELALLGIPSIAMAQNRREEKHGFVCNENGFTYLGLNPPDEVLESNLDMYLELSVYARERFQKMLISHDLHDGRRRVMGLINSL